MPKALRGTILEREAAEEKERQSFPPALYTHYFRVYNSNGKLFDYRTFNAQAS